MRSRYRWGLMCMLLLLAAAGPARPADEAGERRQIAQQRKALLDGFAAEEAACQHRFTVTVTACVNDVRLRRRAALVPLRERELQIDDAQRLHRSAQARADQAARQAGLAARLAASAPASAGRAAKAAPTPASAPSQRFRQDDAQARAATAAQRAQSQQSRVKAAEAAQARVARRLAERASEGKSVTPLPRPASAASAPR